ncbi:ribosomal protein S18-alanine N-acetyltransferase [Pseudoalteromonas sp. T1lg65]|uniref:ribosomal protein S18-alanine N-acetyltransferase n=1 Tax=Pseudoalteromonas sp. T1lg65 TaxID=2077101 RepID=UPI003F7B19A9
MTELKANALNEFTVEQIMAIETACHAFPWTENTMRSCLHGRYFNCAATVENELVGFYIAEVAGPDHTLMDICVHPQWQGKGIAKQLLNELIARSEEMQAENIFLEVRASNRVAIALYEAAGFVEMGIRKNYYPTAQGNEDAILMALPLLMMS